MKPDPILYLKIIMDAILGATLAMLGTLALSRTGHPGSVLPSPEDMEAAAFFVGLPTLLYTFKARISTGLPKVPDAGDPPTPVVVTNSQTEPVETHEAGTP